MVASRYTVNNRVFLVGDACHLHSPNAGQGANASMADGHNLGMTILLYYDQRS
jgi:phenol 2-monooxygenase